LEGMDLPDRSWSGKIELYHSYDRFDDATTEVLTVSGNGPKTYEVKAKGVCVSVSPVTRDAFVWAYIDYNSSFGKMTESDDAGFLDTTMLCAYCESWPDS